MSYTYILFNFIVFKYLTNCICIYKFLFEYEVSFIIHLHYTLHWILCFKLFGNAFPLGVLFCQPKQEKLYFSLYISKVDAVHRLYVLVCFRLIERQQGAPRKFVRKISLFTQIATFLLNCTTSGTLPTFQKPACARPCIFLTLFYTSHSLPKRFVSAMKCTR